MRSIIKIKKQACCVLQNPLNVTIMSLPGVYGVNADLFKGEVTIDHTGETKDPEFAEAIISAGFEPLDQFAHKAEEWDSPEKIYQAKEFIKELRKTIEIKKGGTIIDFGCGTGLAGLELFEESAKMIFADNSPSMLHALESKLSYAELEKSELTEGKDSDIAENSADLLITLMALHHTEYTGKMAASFGKWIKPGGILVIGELNEEDGSFHFPEIVPHNGFNTAELSNLLKKQNFKIIKINNYIKQTKKGKEYSRFILIALNEKEL